MDISNGHVWPQSDSNNSYIIESEMKLWNDIRWCPYPRGRVVGDRMGVANKRNVLGGVAGGEWEEEKEAVKKKKGSRVESWILPERLYPATDLKINVKTMLTTIMMMMSLHYSDDSSQRDKTLVSSQSVLPEVSLNP